MDRIIYAPPFTGLVGVIYSLLALFLIPSYLVGLASVLREIGLGPLEAAGLALAVVFLSLALSPLHVVVYTKRRRVYYPGFQILYVYGFPIPIPQIAYHEERARLAVNLGGAAIPLAFATFILSKLAPSYALGAALTALATSVFVYFLSRVVPGVGVVTPGFIPPLIALFLSLWAGRLTPAVAYVAGIYGTLLGADVYNLRRILDQMPPLASIGGAGVFDGVFLTGIMAAVLALIFR